MSNHSSQGLQTSADQSQTKGTTGRDENPVDLRLTRLIDNTLPQAPYILRIAQRPGYPLPEPTGQSFWQKNTHFSPDEQELQYLSFRSNPAGMLRAHGQWDNGNGALAPNEEATSQTSSGRTPSAAQGARKKISLADYKNRDKSKAAVVPEAKSLSLEAQVESKKPAETKGLLTDHEKITGPDPAVTGGTKPPQAEQSGQECSNERRHHIGKDTASSVQLPAAHSAKEAPATVEPLKSPSQEPASGANSKPKVEAPSAALITDAAMGPKKEPTPPIHEVMNSDRSRNEAPQVSKLRPTVLHDLPPMLSPTLPASIEAELAKVTPGARQGSVSTAHHSSMSSASPSIRTKADENISTSGGKSKKGLGSGIKTHPTSIQRSKEVPAVTSNKVKTAKNVTKDSTILSHAASTISERNQRPKLILKLKIRSKAGRKQLSSYLRLPPTPGKRHWMSQASKQKEVIDDDSDFLLSSGKRPRPQDDEDGSVPSNKRRKTPAWFPQKTSMPKQPLLSSTVSARPDTAQKSHLSAPPLTGLSNSGTSRPGSANGAAATPLAFDKKSPPISRVRKEHPAMQLMKVEYREEAGIYMALAKELKHDADKYLNPQQFPTCDDKQKMLGVVIATESILCYILSSMIFDEPSRSVHKAGNSVTWKSVLGYLTWLNPERTKRFQPLYGLLYQIEAVIRDTLIFYTYKSYDELMEEYNKDQEVSDVAQADETPLEVYHRTFKELRDNDFKARVASAEGSLALSTNELPSKFPKTWTKQRAFPGRGKGNDPVYLKKYGDGGFSLPVSSLTSGLEAVNFGLSILEEFCEIHRVEWVPKLVLSAVSPSQP